MRKNKGNKVYPSPSPSPSLSSSSDALSALDLLPAAILALASVLSLEDREVLGYLITRSINTTTTTTSAFTSSNLQEKKKCKKSNKHPIFDCGCFDCYTSFWFRWDSSPNRELINQAIEAFEEHLTKGEVLSSSKNSSKGSGKKKMGRRVFDRKPEIDQAEAVLLENFLPDFQSEMVMVPALPLTESDRDEYVEVMKEECDEEIEIEMVMENLTQSTETVQFPGNKGLVRKVLPDILGVFNSRLWSLWNPSV